MEKFNMENFNEERFVKYLKYDVKQFCNNHLLSIIMLSCTNVILYFIVGIYSYIFNNKWYTINVNQKLILFIFIFSIFIAYQTRLYGRITQKPTGIRYVLLPVSIKEKFISMIVISCIINPVIFFFTYCFIDFLISIDNLNTYSLLIFFIEILNHSFRCTLLKINIASMILFSVSFYNLYFLFCGIYFQKKKILYGILILFAISTLSPLLIHLIPDSHLNRITGYDNMNFVIFLGNCFSIFLCILMCSLIYQRLKKIQY